METIDVFFRKKNGDLFIIPSFQPSNGPSRSFEGYEILAAPYEKQEIGAKIRLAYQKILDVYQSNNVHGGADIEFSPGYKSYRKFLNEWSCILVLLSDKKIEIQSWCRSGNGYEPEPEIPELIIPIDCDNETLGQYILKMFDYPEREGVTT